MSDAGRRPSLALRLAVVVAATAAGLLVAEGLARLIGPEARYGRLFSLGEAPTRDVDGVTLWSEARPRATVADVRRAAAGDARVVLGLGDSIMYGVGLEPGQTYLEQARRRLAERGTAVEILNLAVPGYNTQQEAAVHRELGDRLRPDLVLLHYWDDDGRTYRVVGGYVVDIGDMSVDGRLVVRALPLPAALNDFLLVHSRLYELLTRWAVERDRRVTASDFGRVAPALADLNRRVTAAGGRLVVLASAQLDGARPRPSGDLPLLRTLGAAEGFEVVDLSEWLPAADPATIRFDHCHLNAEGHRLLGDRLAEYLRSQ